jgi:predicted lipoprotein with Yx(FWY)xxD motif
VSVACKTECAFTHPPLAARQAMSLCVGVVVVVDLQSGNMYNRHLVMVLYMDIFHCSGKILIIGGIGVPDK